MLWEAMIAEHRATYQDFANRRHFTKEGQQITTTRALFDELCAPDVITVEELQARASASASNLQHAADSGFIEVG